MEFFLGFSSFIYLTLVSERRDGTCDLFLNALAIHYNPSLLPQLEQLDMNLGPQAGFTPEVYSSAIRATQT